MPWLGLEIIENDILIVVVSIWTPIGITFLLATYPAIAFICGPLRRWRRRRIGHCLDCGYDLTGNESGVCPDCGTGVP